MTGDRYSLVEYAARETEFAEHVANLQSPLAELLRRAELTSTEAISPSVRGNPALPVYLHLDKSTAANVGRTLLDFDVELRRSAAYMTNGSIRPLRDIQIEVMSAKHTNSVSVVIACAHEIHFLLTSRPITFLQLLDWLWSHRLNQTKVRRPNDHIDPNTLSRDLVNMVASCIERDQPVILTADINNDGAARFEFRSI